MKPSLAHWQVDEIVGRRLGSLTGSEGDFGRDTGVTRQESFLSRRGQYVFETLMSDVNCLNLHRPKISTQYCSADHLSLPSRLLHRLLDDNATEQRPEVSRIDCFTSIRQMSERFRHGIIKSILQLIGIRCEDLSTSWDLANDFVFRRLLHYSFF